MIPIVKRILLRRSGTRNMFRRRDSMGARPPLDSPKSGGERARGRGSASLSVGQRVPAGRRTSVAPGRRNDLDPAARTLDGADRALRERVRSDCQRLGELAPTEDLHQAALGHEAVRAQNAGVDLVAGVERFQGVEVHHDVLDAERVLEALGLRRTAVQRRLATLEPGRDVVAGALALGTPAGGLAALAGDAAADATPRGLGPGRRLQIVDLHALTSSTVTRCGTRAIIPRISGRSGSSTVWLIRFSPSARMVPRCFGFVPIVDLTWVTRSTAITRPRPPRPSSDRRVRVARARP